ncbi:MAG: 30S ribosomal protein S20 [Candidatus Ryanbacteria bacterium RIFCSPHIGHO2_02_FULL_45_17b]|uniref:Small ribosomal subunit protein bS20 n=1 Tax=Candidatus Ryanbacteria bacterium RIFCSPHIGHO2_01_FULL_45_22 TaxID=1802114 RepID=A0A1G2G2Y9_9BACT|nr:MAG: 30S ribosomal protein S20 [Candidatus Ryanbacteria bacterium RIFCSPHIGHO2_01_FULL_45_22]OGZ47491.1 MAG: 30S ribosomal protein S20 [Candidatus Ryanbacteria bacterium RIFCSPHIGHO2_02_FULL_45_17b]
MPNTSSAKKALRQSAKRRVQNTRHKRAVADTTKQIRKLIESGKYEEAAALLGRAYKEIDKAAKTRVLKKNTAARKKSRVARLVIKK